MRKAISNRKLYPALAGAIVAAVTCGVALKLIQTSSQPEPEIAAQVPGQDTSADSEAEVLAPLTPFESGPFVQATPGLRLADPSLLRSTSPNARVDAVVAGRSDPFAPIVRPSATSPRPRPTAQQTVTTPPSQVSRAQTLPVVPVASTQPLPPLPMLPTPVVPGSIPQITQEVAVAPTAPVLQSPIDQIAITGVAQIGDAVSVIVRESTGASSRHVKVGGMLAGGQVRVKSIDTSSAEPVVVLTYNGQDYTRTVGSGTLIGSL
jgi:hypothetical protein